MADAPETSAPKIQIDTDWKAQALKEKERLAKQEQEKAKAVTSQAARSGEQVAGAPGEGGVRAGAGSATGAVPGANPGLGPGAGGLPQADFRTLVGMLAQQAIMGLGVMADQQSGRVVVDLEGARFSIDLLDVLDQKTKNNLTPEEANDLKQILAELRSRYVQISNLVARQVAAQAQAQMKAAEQKLAT